MKKIAMRIVVSLFVFVFFVSSYNICVCASLLKRGGSSEKVAAPDFSLETVSGKTVSLSGLKGKGVVLFFFTTWCPYCRSKVPMLSKEYSQCQDQGIEFLLIDTGESKAKVASFVAKEHLSFDILLDIKMNAAEDYGIVGVPTFILVSKEGFVVYEGNDLPDNYAELLK
jgi:peroxiredoxin